MKSKQRILLTGASGGVGFEALKQLHATKNFRITVFDLKTVQSKKAFSRFKEDIEIIYGDITNIDDLTKACIEKDVVIHLAAIIPPLADEKPELSNSVNIGGTENLLRVLEQYSPNAFFLYSSSVSVYGDRIENPYIKVTDPLTPSIGDEYALTKIAAEDLIKRSKLNWSIFRLCAIMGKHKISKLMFHQPLNTSLEIATLEDTARAFVKAIDKKEALSGRIFNLGGGKKCRSTYKAFLERSFDIFGLGKLAFPPKSFADKNFHCGFYEDGDDLEDILHFQRDTLESYFEKEKKKISPVRKVLTSIFRRVIKFFLKAKSEPLQAFKDKDEKAMEQYFTSNESRKEEGRMAKPLLILSFHRK